MDRMRNKKVLLTGASGFIGSHLSRQLLLEGADLTALLRYNSIEHNVRLSTCWDDIKKFEADMRSIESLRPLGKEAFDYVFHLAAYNHVGNSFQHANEALETNCQGTANLLESIEEYERFVYISTSEVYGLQEVVPFIEHQYPHPMSPYSVGKYAGELYSLMKEKQANRPIVVLRPFNAFGPYQSTRAVIPELIVKCLLGEPVLTTEGLQTREFNYVTNLTEGMVRVALAENVNGEIINLGCGQDIAIRDVARMIHEKSNSVSELNIGAIPTRANEIWKMKADAEKARRLFDWQPKVSFEDGLIRTIEWFKKYMDVFHRENSPLVALGSNII